MKIQLLLQLLETTLLLRLCTTDDSSKYLRHLNPTGNGETYPPMCGSYNETEDAFDVVIVGSGWAGITALWKIQDFNAAYSGEGITVKLFEKESFDMGRGVAAHWMNGGDGNPVVKLWKTLSGGKVPTNQYKVVDLDTPGPSRANYYNDNGNLYLNTVVGEERMKFEGNGVGYPCLEDVARNYHDNAPGGNKDRSFRDILENDCQWNTPVEGTIQDIMEYYRINYEFGTEAENLGQWNLPLVNNDDFGPSHWYTIVSGESAHIGTLWIAAYNLNQYIEKNRAVIKIYWDKDDRSDFPVRVKTKGHSCYDIKAKKVIFTPSIGVLERRGDCLHVDPPGGDHTPRGCDAAQENLVLFDPVIDEMKMEAIRRLFIDPDRREDQAGMAEYKELRFQFQDKFWPVDKEYYAFETPNERGFNWWQNLDGYGYSDTNSMVAAINTEKWDELTGNSPEKKLNHADIMALLNDSLGQLSGPQLECVNFVDHFHLPPQDWYPGYPISWDSVSFNCVYSYFPGWVEDQASEDEIDNWYGSYVTWNVGKNNNAIYQDWQDYIAPLKSNGKNVVHISGTGTCDRHQSYVHGAYYSGIRTARIVLEELTGVLDTSTPEYCDAPPPTQIL